MHCQIVLKGVNDFLLNQLEEFLFSYWKAGSVWSTQAILTTKQLILYWYFKEKIKVVGRGKKG